MLAPRFTLFTQFLLARHRRQDTGVQRCVRTRPSAANYAMTCLPGRPAPGRFWLAPKAIQQIKYSKQKRNI